MRPTPIYLHNLKLAVTPSFETQFEAFLKRVTDAHNGTIDSSQSPINKVNHVNINKRKISVAINNSWRDEEGDLMTNLYPPDHQGICKATNSINLEKYIEHKEVALCIKVHYTALLPTRGKSTPVEFIVGWDVFMPMFNDGKEVFPMQPLDFFCQQGPGVSVMKDLLWSSDEIEGFNLRVSGQLSTSINAPPDTQ